MDECIEQCLQCHVVCTMTAQYCLVKGGDHAAIGTVGVLLDCAQICQVSADFMIRGSPFHTLTCAACAEVCRSCADACRAAGDDEELAHCADMCEACADSCERMSDGVDADDADDADDEDDEDER
jgi:hypothetical protein